MTISKKFLTTALATIGLLAATTASLAVGAHATVSLNVRSGPGTSFNVLDVLFSGETVDVTECVTQNSKNWCRIEHSGPDGWVSSNYLEANTPPAPPAPTPTPTPTPTPPPSGGASDPNCSFGLVLGPSGPTFSITCGDNPPAPTPPAPPPPPAPVADEVCFYTGANFTGQSFCSGVGLYNSLPDMAIFNDEISSVKMFGNAHVKLWKHINQGGISRVYNNSRTNLHGNINNQASSYRVFTGTLAPTPATVQLNGTYTIVQKSNGRYLDAHQGSNDDSAVTRNSQNNDTQRWIVSPLGNNVFTIRQKSNGRYLDAHTSTANDYSAVTRANQNNNTQRWTLTKVGTDTYTIQQVSNGRYLDAHTSNANDYSAVTRPSQNNNTQRWIIKPPSVAPVAVTVSTGPVALQSSFAVNIDNGTITSDGGADIRYLAVTAVEKYLQPINGAAFSISGASNRGFAGCSTATYSNANIPLGTFAIGTYVCVRTTANRYTEFRLNGYTGTTMNLGYTTWAN